MIGKSKIIVADDEANIRELASLYLRKDGHEVMIAGDGTEALHMAKAEKPDLLVLDLMMPGIDGWEVCRRLRRESDLPILMLTARDSDLDKVVGLEMGADDYLTKPFNPRELVARVRAILRRTDPDHRRIAPGLQSFGNTSVNVESREVIVDGRSIGLSVKEFDLLTTLADHLNIVLSRDQLLDLVWGYADYGKTRTVDVHVANLRDKLAESDLSIETVWGVGYKLTA